VETPRPLTGVVRELDHVAIVVASIAQARGAWEGLGLVAGEIEHVPDQRVNVLVCTAGGQRFELVEPAADDSPVRNFLEQRGGGLHHLAFRVDDLVAALAELKGRGLRLIDETPRPGAHGTRVAFVHPKSVGGVLVELVEDPNHPRS